MYTPGEPMTARSTDLEDRNKPLAHAKEGDSTRKFSVDSTTTFSDGHGNMREVTPWFGTGRARYWAEMQKESLPPPKP